MDGMRADILSHRVLPCATMNTKFVVRRIGILSFAKLQSALYALFGLIAGAFISLLAALGSVLHDVYAIPPAKVLRFFTRDERNWHEYLQRSDAFTPEAFAEVPPGREGTIIAPDEVRRSGRNPG